MLLFLYKGGANNLGSVGENIKKIRKDMKKTQEQMANILGISRSYLANLESGRKNVGENTIRAMAEKSGLSTYYLTTGEKTTYDMSPAERNKLINVEVDSILNTLNKSYDERLKETLIEISNSHLSAIEVIYLLNAISYLNDSGTEDIKIMASILRSLVYYNNILNEKIIFPEDAEQIKEEDILKEIEDTTAVFNRLLKRRYGYEEKSD